MSKIHRVHKGVVYGVGDVFTDDAGNLCTVRANGTLGVTTVNNDPSLTIQSEKDECDINKIVAKFKTTGVMSNIRTDQPKFGDFSDVCDFQTACIRVQEAQDSFMSLPATVRARFSNDPGELISFLENPDNRDEAAKLGLISSPPPEVPSGVPPTGDGSKATPEGG